MYTCICADEACVFMYMSVYMYMYMYVYMSMYMSMYMYACVHVEPVYVNLHVMCLHMYMSMYVYTHINIICTDIMGDRTWCTRRSV